MQRRDFLKLASVAGLGVVAGGLPFARRAHAGAPYTGPLYVTIQAEGGWDTTMVCDPKGAASLSDPNKYNSYLTSAIKQAGNIRYAPIGTNQAFFSAHHQDILVINGIDCATNNHDTGQRYTWSGSLLEGSPAFSALAAGVLAPSQPLAFLSHGGYGETAGVVAPTRVGAVSALDRVVYPEVVSPGIDDSPFHPPATRKRIKDALKARSDARLAGQNLPRLKRAESALFVARAGEDDLRKIMPYMPASLDPNPLKAQCQVAVAAYRAGVCVAADLFLHGFDTHSNNDATQTSLMSELLDGTGFLLNELAKYPETIGNAVVVVGSDFGRTPLYNSGNGKDHWSIGSMMVMGKGVTGNRVVGGTDAKLAPLMLDPVTLAPSASGVRLTPRHVHAALRKLAGIDADPIVAAHPLGAVEDMPLFG